MFEKGQGNINYPLPPPRDKDEESLIEEHDENGTRVRRYEKSESADIQEPAVQVETKAGASWTEPEPQAPIGRKKTQKIAGVVDTEPLIQVETKIAPSETDAVVPPEVATLPGVAEMEKNQQIIPSGEKREFHKDGSEYVDFTDDKEGTVAENRGMFKEVMAKAAEKFGWYKSSDEKLIRRNEELDALGEKIGGIDGERLFRKMGEKYNKMPFWSKLVLGGALGVGATVGASASIPLAFACMSGIAVQRLAGFATMYMKFEKKSHEEKWGKEKAMAKAGVYTVLLGLTMKEAIEYASGTAPAHWAQAKVEGWLGSMFGHHAAVPETTVPPKIEGHPTHETPNFAHPDTLHPVAPDGEAPTAAPDIKPSEVPHPAAVAGEAVVTAPPTPEAVPEILKSVEATRGKGYEYMMQKLVEKLPADFDKDSLPKTSDMYRLLHPEPKSFASVLHDIATENEFYKEDGTSVQIDLDSKLSVDTKGNIWFGDDNDIIAPEGAKVTPVYHPEAPIAPVAEPLPDVTPEEAANGIFIKETPASVHEAPSVPTSVEPVTTSGGIELGPHGYINSLGTPINPDMTGPYLSEKGVYFFGGDSDNIHALAQDYVLKNKVPVFVDESYKSFWGSNVSKVVEFAPTESGPPAMIIHSDASLVPDPRTTFTKRLF